MNGRALVSVAIYFWVPLKVRNCLSCKKNARSWLKMGQGPLLPITDIFSRSDFPEIVESFLQCDNKLPAFDPPDIYQRGQKYVVQ